MSQSYAASQAPAHQPTPVLTRRARGRRPAPPPAPPPRTFRLEPPKPDGKLTRQGVRDLNGPRMNGTGYNGRRSASCPHHRDPQSVPHFDRAVLSVDDAGFPMTTHQTCCSRCGQVLDIEARTP